MLLFGDDNILLSQSIDVLQKLLDSVDLFCRDTGLTISLPKTKCMYLDGYSGQGSECRGCMLGDKMVEVVKQFKYLGWEFDNRFDLCNMGGAQPIKGK